VIVNTMLPILIIPDHATESDEGPRLEQSHSCPNIASHRAPGSGLAEQAGAFGFVLAE
jgi:hypothetical protein